MNDLLLCGLALGSIGVAALASGVEWFATAAFVAAIPFLAVGVLLAFSEPHVGDDRPADSVN